MMYTPESYGQRVERWQAVDGASPLTFPVREGEELRTRRIYDVERVAVTLLRQARITHPLLRVHVRRICSDPAYAEYDLPAPESITVQEWRETLYPHYIGYMDEQIIELVRAWGSMLSPERELAYPGNVPVIYRILDEAASGLASAIVTHRLQGEDGAETVTGLGFGLAVNGSLAAEIVAYHNRVVKALDQN